MWWLTWLGDDSWCLPGDAIDQDWHQPGAEHHQHLGAADAAVAVGGPRALQIPPDGGHNLQRQRQEGNVHQDVSVGDQGVADSVWEDKLPDTLLVNREYLDHDAMQNIAA